MNKRKFCSECGKEYKTEFRKKNEIKENISSMIGFDIWKLQGDMNTFLELEKKIKKFANSEKSE